MKNLKRALSFALATVMLIGMMVMGVSAADFGDADEIVNTDAVNTLYALGIVDGKDDGNYDPTGIVTRAEMAKLICVALNGGKAPVLGTKAEPTYTDIKGHWAESYIEYCASLGIVSGRGDGTFDPGATVTGNEAAKMMLVAMGWDSKIFNFTGASWAINVGVEANKAKLFKGLEAIDPSEGLIRDNTAQLVFNGILADTMVKSPSMTVTGGEVTWHYTAEGPSIFEEKFDGAIEYAYITGTSYDEDTKEYTYDYNTTGIDTDALTITELVSTEDYSDLFRMKVKVIYEDEDDTVFGVYAADSAVVTSGIVNDLPAAADINATDKTVKVNKVTYKLDDEIQNIPVYAFNEDTAAGNLYSFKSTVTNKPYSIDLIDNDGNGKVNLAVVYPFTVAKVEFVGRDTFKAGTTVKFEDVNVYEGIAKNDFVKITAAANTVDNTDTYEKIETVLTGKVEAEKTGMVKIDGTWYKLATGVTATLGSTYKDMPVVNTYIFASTLKSAVATVEDYAVITNLETAPTGLNKYPRAILLLTTGEKITVDLALKDADGNSITYTTDMKDTLVTFDVDDDVYTLTPATAEAFDGAAVGSYVYDKDGDSTIATYSIADDAVVFLKGSSSTKVVTGAELKTSSGITGVTNAYYNEDDSTGFKTIAMAYVTGAISSTSDNLYGYVTAAKVAVKDDDNKTVYEITLWNGEETVTLTTKNGTNVDAVANGALVVYKVNGSGLITSIKAITAANSIDTGIAAVKTAVTAYNGTKLQVEDIAGTYELDDDTVVLFINSEDKVGVEGGVISKADKDVHGLYIDNVYIAVNAENKVVLLVVDDANEMQ